MQLSDHGESRIRKRLAKPRKSALKLAKFAWQYGNGNAAFKGRFRKYLDFWCREYRSIAKVYRGNIFFYAPDAVHKDDHVLITCWPVPTKYQKYLKRAERGNSGN